MGNTRGLLRGRAHRYVPVAPKRGSLNNAQGFPLDYERFLLDNLPAIEQAVQFIARRHHLSRDEADELSSSIKLKLIDRDYEVLRRYEGRSSLRTYLTAIAHRHFLDARTSVWGRWRPSARARQIGPEAILLDRLITRDGLTVIEAFEVMRTNHGVRLTSDEVQAMAGELPSRAGRRFLDDEKLSDLASTIPPPDSMLQDAGALAEADRVEDALAAALGGLEDEDRLVLKLHFHDGHQVSTISRLLGLEQKPLYRRIERLKALLRRELEARGVTREQIVAIVGHPAVALAPVLEPDRGGNMPPRPSIG
jgi:RNA polymerase sigma factor (sigma-70 family)